MKDLNDLLDFDREDAFRTLSRAHRATKAAELRASQAEARERKMTERAITAEAENSRLRDALLNVAALRAAQVLQQVDVEALVAAVSDERMACITDDEDEREWEDIVADGAEKYLRDQIQSIIAAEAAGTTDTLDETGDEEVDR